MSDTPPPPDSNAALSPVLQAIYGQLKEIHEIRAKAKKALKDCDILEEKLNKAHFELTGKDLKNFAFAQVTTGEIQNKFTYHETFITLSDSPFTNKRFWRRSGFEGWKVFTLNYIAREKRLVSLSDFVEMTGEQDKLERKALQSAISNALSTNYSRGEVIKGTVKGFSGKYYGLPEFLNDMSMLNEIQDELAHRLNVPVEYIDLNLGVSLQIDYKKRKPSNEGSKNLT